MSLFPVFLKLEGRPCLMVGAGNVAMEKIEALLQAGAGVHVVAPRVLPAVAALVRAGRITLALRPFRPRDLQGRTLIVTATDSRAVNHAVYRAAQQAGILCNSVDDPPNCDFYFASTIRRGPLQIAISTAGESPALAQRLRRELDAALPQELAAWVQELGELRREVIARCSPGEPRKVLLHRLAHLPLCGAESCPTRQLAANPPSCKEALL
jgi:siroheme synthase-like protein